MKMEPVDPTIGLLSRSKPFNFKLKKNFPMIDFKPVLTLENNKPVSYYWTTKASIAYPKKPQV